MSSCSFEHVYDEYIKKHEKENAEIMAKMLNLDILKKVMEMNPSFIAKKKRELRQQKFKRIFK